MSGFTLPASFSIVGLGVAGAIFLNLHQFTLVTNARRESGVKYPNLYASDAEARADPKKMRFNCIQRAHANTLEQLLHMLAAAGYFSLFYPILATALFLTWIFGRFFYTVNYAKGDPSKRNVGIANVYYVGLIGCLAGSIGMATIKAYQVLAAKLF